MGEKGVTKIDELIHHLESGGQIFGCGQWLCKIKEDNYFLCCDTDGCCDQTYTKAEALDYIGDGDGWEKCAL